MAAKIKLNLPSSLWTTQDSLRLASNTLASIKLRTGKGLDADGRPFKPYSTTPIYVAKRGARLQPKGGRPSRTGKSIYYEGGYKQYKDQSRRRGQSTDSAEVDLVLSGNMMNNLVVKKATKSGFTIGLTKHAQYGFAVNETREFIGLSPNDVEVLVDAVREELRRKL
jgi:hypothetical protein